MILRGRFSFPTEISLRGAIASSFLKSPAQGRENPLKFPAPGSFDPLRWGLHDLVGSGFVHARNSTRYDPVTSSLKIKKIPLACGNDCVTMWA